MHWLVAFTVVVSLVAIEVPATVTYVTDGDTIAVTLPDAAEAKVRLLYVDTPESRPNRNGPASPEGKLAADFLRGLLPPGTSVILVGPGAQLDRDRYQRLLAVVLMPAASGSGGSPTMVQEAIIRAGWSPLWEKFGRVPVDWQPRLVQAEAAAREATAGAWATNPQYMIDTGNETTAAPERK